MYIISRCLLGVNCKYNGGNNLTPDVVQFCKEHAYVTVCPESAGGLKSPREPAELLVCKDGNLRVTDRGGIDRTEAFVRGAQISLQEALDRAEALGEPVEGAVLKARSPSCGVRQIYDGTFSGTLIPGDGIFTRMLRARGIPVMTEQNLKENHTNDQF
ncbi:MAG: DUF523 domain-containing protein [Mogibacterium sp.]|nr:DUF523 domain-containing protein [Mogibacterium sp.]